MKERGVLTKEQNRELKSYVTELKLLGPGPARDRVLKWLRDTVGDRAARNALPSNEPSPPPDLEVVEQGSTASEQAEPTGECEYTDHISGEAGQDIKPAGTLCGEAEQEAYLAGMLTEVERDTGQGSVVLEESERELVPGSTMSEAEQETAYGSTILEDIEREPVLCGTLSKKSELETEEEAAAKEQGDLLEEKDMKEEENLEENHAKEEEQDGENLEEKAGPCGEGLGDLPRGTGKRTMSKALMCVVTASSAHGISRTLGEQVSGHPRTAGFLNRGRQERTLL